MKKKIIYNYITTNLLNGKQYIGMHSTEVVDDGYLGGGILILRAIKKYGKKNFEREILKVCETPEEAFANEMVFIGQHNTLHPNGYNLSPTGGLGLLGCHSEETREKMSLAQSGENNPRYGKDGTMKGRKLSEETIQKISLALSGENHPMFGKKHSDETIQKMSEVKKGENNSRSKKVIHLSSGNTYDCIKDCADFMDINYSTLSYWLNGRGSRKDEFEYLDKYEQILEG